MHDVLSPESPPHLTSEQWCELGTYHDSVPRGVKCRRLLWLTVVALFFRPWPYFLGRRFRLWLLSSFGARIGRHVTFFPSVRVWAPWNFSCGEYVAFDHSVYLYSVAPIIIGSKVAISEGAFLCTASHDISRASRPLTTAPIRVGDGAWIGARAFIHPGVTIGEGAVVGACAVVTRDVPPWAVVAGNPARIVKMRELKELSGADDVER